MGRRLLLLFALPLSLAAQGTDTTLLQRMLVAEDSRPKDAAGLVPLLEGAAHADLRLRRVAVRGLGRLQRADEATLAPLRRALADPLSDLRMEGANALAQRVQGLPRAAGASGAEVRATMDLLLDALTREADARVAGVIVRSLGRLPLGEPALVRSVARAAQAALARLVTTGGGPADGAFGQLPAAAVHDIIEGLYSLTRARRALGDPSADAKELLVAAARYPRDARVRRVALLALTVGGALDSAVVRIAVRDADAQVRRFALAGVATLEPTERATLVRAVLADPVAMVRVDAIRAARVGSDTPDCAPVIAATRDRDPHVMLAAIDALGLRCADTTARNATLAAIAARPQGPAPGTAWHGPAHALVALARADAASAAKLLARFTASDNAHVREYAARAATILKDPGTLLHLSSDANHNTQDAAITGLSQVQRHAADSVFIRALASPGYQVVLAAAGALAGSTNAAAVPALLDAFDRLSAERRENSRDPRVAVLARLEELGAPLDAPRIERSVTDFDTTVAAQAAALLTKWTGRPVAARAAPLPILTEPLAAIASTRNLTLRITMGAQSGGGTFLVRLFADEAPATVARLVRLARAGYFNGLTFHRIATNFVLQGGSPDAVEFVGDGPFMRDELGLRSHDRGTLGISTRGRDTGDAQLFINVVDNPRLDHDYTVFGEIVAGMGVVDRIVEGGVMIRVEVLGRP